MNGDDGDTDGLVVDDAGRVGHFADAEVGAGSAMSYWVLRPLGAAHWAVVMGQLDKLLLELTLS